MTTTNQKNRTFKVGLVGDGAVGKSTFVASGPTL